MNSDGTVEKQALSILFSAAAQCGLDPEHLIKKASLLVDSYSSNPDLRIHDIEATKRALSNAFVDSVMN